MLNPLKKGSLHACELVIITGSSKVEYNSGNIKSSECSGTPPYGKVVITAPFFVPVKRPYIFLRSKTPLM